MSEILEFVVKNFQLLRPTDYALLIVFVALASAAIFAAFRWLYSERFEAQKELVEVQKETVLTLSLHLELSKREHDETRRELESKVQRLIELESIGESAKNELTALQEDTYSLLSVRLIAYLDRLAMGYNLLFCYQRNTNTPPPAELVMCLEDFASVLGPLRETYVNATKHRDSATLAHLIREFQSENLAESAQQVYERFMAI